MIKKSLKKVLESLNKNELSEVEQFCFELWMDKIVLGVKK